MVGAWIAAWQAHRGMFVALLLAPMALALAWWATELRPRVRWVETGEHYDEFEFTPDGHSLLTRSEGNLILRDATTGQKRLSLLQKTESGWGPMDEMLSSQSITPDGRTLVGEVIGDKGTVLLKMWDLATGKERISLGPIHENWLDRDATMLDGPSYANHVRSADGKVVAFTHYRPDGSIAGEVWEVECLKRLAAFEHCMPMAVSTDGKILVACDSEIGRIPPPRPPMVRVRDVASGREILAFASPVEIPRCTASISPEGRFLAVAAEGYVTIWDLEAGREIFSSAGQNSVMSGTDRPPWFSQDGRFVFPSGMPRFGSPNRSLDLSTSPPRRMSRPVVAGGSGTIFTPDGRGVVAFGPEAGFRPGPRPGMGVGPKSTRWWSLDYPSGRQKAYFEGPSSLRDAAISPDGRTLFIAIGRPPASFIQTLLARILPMANRQSAIQGQAILVDVATGKRRGAVNYSWFDDDTSQKAFSPDGHLLAIRHAETRSSDDLAAENEEDVEPLKPKRVVEIWDVPIRSPNWGLAIALLAAVAPAGLGWLARVRRGRGLVGAA